MRVLRHGASPRILLAAVVGSRGTTQVTGGTLAQRFGLLTTLAAFTTITTAPRSGHGLAADGRTGMLGLFTLQRSLAAARLPALHGASSPAVRVIRYRVEQLVAAPGRRSCTCSGPAGRSQRVRAPGRYRVVYRGLDGPAVDVG